MKQHTERFLNLDDCINAYYNYESLYSHLVSQPNSNKYYKNFVSSTQEDLVPFTFGELIPKDQIRKNESKNMGTSRYIKILMDCGASASVIHDSFVRTNKFNTSVLC